MQEHVFPTGLGQHEPIPADVVEPDDLAPDHSHTPHPSANFQHPHPSAVTCGRSRPVAERIPRRLWTENGLRAGGGVGRDRVIRDGFARSAQRRGVTGAALWATGHYLRSDLENCRTGVH
ncbi:hypothetical protein GCM10010171_34310 [Actinokineospora fastidiosa]|uniref:Uncharacterized protein n=1 Tax=Actinokineospora fastidiosa TaxID=1816 RepID=A0A918GHA3_9PSEU|nr:hypothetical protein GCM10010171_34310 [Actinokineospora fastidiosa]